MSRQNDIGGMPAGAVNLSDKESEPWVKKMVAVAGALVSRGHYDIDQMRRTIEDLPKEQYDLPYDERWLAAILHLLEEKNLLTLSEIETRMAGLKRHIEANK
jgi:hypothetical protein